MLKFYAGFEINDQTGEALTDGEMIDLHYHRMTSLQVRLLFRFTALHFKFILSIY